LDSFGSFDRGKRAAGKPQGSTVADRVPTRGHRGGLIVMHRALTHFRLGPMNLAAAICLFLCFSAIWLLLLPRICQFWAHVLAVGLRILPLHAELGLARHHLTAFIGVDIPFLRMEPVLASSQDWWLTCAVTVAFFAGTFLLRGKLLPVRYLLRGILLVPATALVYFLFLPSRFPHTPDSYIEGLITAETALISAIPLLFGLTYYIFDFGLLKKAFLTAIAMTHLALFLPIQILLQALFLQKTVLFMPILYIIFAMPINILIIVAFYSWGMTWSFRSANNT
jgi:hypothetical protein